MNLYDNSFVLCETSDTKNDAICMSLGNIEGAGRGVAKQRRYSSDSGDYPIQSLDTTANVMDVDTPNVTLCVLGNNTPLTSPNSTPCALGMGSVLTDSPIPNLDTTAFIIDVDTPNVENLHELSDISLGSVRGYSSDSGGSQSSSVNSSDGLVSDEFGTDSAMEVLKELRIKNINRVIIGTLNINSVSSKLEQLREVIGNYLDVLTIQETKLDTSFPTAQLLIDGYSEPYRLDRDCHGGGVLIYVREDIPSKLLNKHTFTKNVEGLFIEINLRKCKILFFGGYRSEHKTFGLNREDFFDQIGLALDIYNNYDKFLLAGDFNTEERVETLEDFLFEHNARNLVKGSTCFKSLDNPSCIDLFITNSYQSFQNTTIVATGLSDFHKMVATVLKTTFPKAPPKVINYRDYKRFNVHAFRGELKSLLSTASNYAKFEELFLKTLDKHAPVKKKVVRANDKPYMTKTLRKAIMVRSSLKNKYMKYKTPDLERAFKKQKNYTNRLLKKEKKRYFSNLDLSNFTDNKKFWNTVKPLLSSGGSGIKKITLVENNEIISDDKEIAETFGNFFVETVSKLDINENNAILNNTKHLCDPDPVKKALNKFNDHPSILEIRKNVKNELKFSFTPVTEADMIKEIETLDEKKSGTFMNIPTKILKEAKEEAAAPLAQIWNNEVILNLKFPSKLKTADITPLFKKLESVLKENYRPVSLLPVVSKNFERIMQKQMKPFMDIHLSSHLCGYRKGYNSQYALVAMIEKWKKTLDRMEKGSCGKIGAIMMDLSKAFDTINYELLIAKLDAYGFHDTALHIILDYLSDRWQRVKVNGSFSDWFELLCGVPQGSVLGPLLFNIYINDLFYLFINTDACNFADDTTLSAGDVDLETLLHNLEDDTLSAILWFENNYMKLNQGKCHFLTHGTTEVLWAKVGKEMIWESKAEKLLGVTVDKNLTFNTHLSNLCKKANQKVSALARIARILPFHKRRLIFKSFIESQFSYCPLVWMFCSRKMNRKMNYIHERALRLVYNDYTSTFKELLKEDKTLSFHHRNIHCVAIEM